VRGEPAMAPERDSVTECVGSPREGLARLHDKAGDALHCHHC
jgi:hypothetical protein